VQVALVTPAIVELPKGTVGSDERVLEAARAEQVVELVRGLTTIRES
jgi:hypothetical protein